MRCCTARPSTRARCSIWWRTRWAVHAHPCRWSAGAWAAASAAKESQSALFACVAAVAARQLGCPVKLRLDRDDDFLITGRRHCFWYEAEVGYDDAGRPRRPRSPWCRAPAIRPTCPAGDDARAVPLRQRLLAARRRHARLLREDQHAEQHRLPRLRRAAGRDRHRTHPRQRSRAAGPWTRWPCGANPTARPATTTPYGRRCGQRHPRTGGQLEATSDYRRRAARWPPSTPPARCRQARPGADAGEVRHLLQRQANQAGALVHVYSDGSILVNHGGTEMGQGPEHQGGAGGGARAGRALRARARDGHRHAQGRQHSATAASTGSDLNGKAAQDAARQIRERLAAFAAQLFGGTAAAVRFGGGQVEVGGITMPFADPGDQGLPTACSSGRRLYATPGLSWDRDRCRAGPSTTSPTARR